MCVILYDRNGALHVKPLGTEPSGYMIPLSLSYSYPEIELSKPLKAVAVHFPGGTDGYDFMFPASSTGEVQTVNNDFIYTYAQAEQVAEWIKETLETRKKIKGEFRADPRLDLFDIVFVETKYGGMVGVVITNIKYTFNGTFSGSYEGRVVDGITPVLGSFILDVSRLM